MSLITLFTKQSPKFQSGEIAIEFDAVFEDTISAGVDYTQYPVEIGATATDHGIILPAQYTITAGVSNNPLSIGVSDLAFGLASNFVDSAAFNAFGSFLSSFLAGSNQTRAGTTLEMLFSIMYNRSPFDIDAGEVTLQNMVITNITRTKDASTEGGLIFTAELQELPLISTVITRNQPGQSVLRLGSPEQTQATATTQKGEVRLGAVVATVAALASNAL